MAKDERAAAKSTDPVSVVRFGRRQVEDQFTRDNATLLAQLAGRLKLALSAESGDFFSRDVSAQITFVKDATGQVTGNGGVSSLALQP